MSGEEIDNGGPAFPMVCLGDPGHPGSVPGMSLRDWFAGQAMMGLMADTNFDQLKERVASLCYELADAMLEARKVRS